MAHRLQGQLSGGRAARWCGAAHNCHTNVPVSENHTHCCTRDPFPCCHHGEEKSWYKSPFVLLFGDFKTLWGQVSAETFSLSPPLHAAHKSTLWARASRHLPPSTEAPVTGPGAAGVSSSQCPGHKDRRGQTPLWEQQEPGSRLASDQGSRGQVHTPRSALGSSAGPRVPSPVSTASHSPHERCPPGFPQTYTQKEELPSPACRMVCPTVGCVAPTVSSLLLPV